MTSLIYFVLGAVLIVSILGIFAMPVDSQIPPTRAFSSVTMAGQNITANSYNGSFDVVVQGDLTGSISDDSITIKLKEFTCPESEFISGVHANGTWICS